MKLAGVGGMYKNLGRVRSWGS